VDVDDTAAEPALVQKLELAAGQVRQGALAGSGDDRAEEQKTGGSSGAALAVSQNTIISYIRRPYR
jgi:hypothetical protein